MVIINHFISDKKIELEIRGSFQERSDFNKNHHKMMQHGYKWNKVRRTYHKVYYIKNNRKYIDECFARDVELVKDVWTHYKLYTYKLLRSEGNI